MDIGVFVEMDLAHIVLVYIADDPHMRQVGYGERIRWSERLDPR
jgi:hypothetical protein